MPNDLATIALSSAWPFDLAATLQSGQVFQWHLHHGGFLGLIGNAPVFVDQPSHDRLRCTVGMEASVRHYLGLDHDLPAIAATFPQNDEALLRAIAWCPGLRLIRQPHWECLATFITSSLKQVPHIRKISLTLRERFGEPISFAGYPQQYNYPSAEALAAAGEHELRACGLGYRAAFLHRTAVAVRDGDIDLEAIQHLDDVAALAALCTLHGVGKKIASCALLFAWDRHGAFPIDVWIERAITQLYFPRARRLTPQRIHHFAHSHFGPARGYAQQYLFHWARLTDCGRKQRGSGGTEGI